MKRKTNPAQLIFSFMDETIKEAFETIERLPKAAKTKAEKTIQHVYALIKKFNGIATSQLSILVRSQLKKSYFNR